MTPEIVEPRTPEEAEQFGTRFGEGLAETLIKATEDEPNAIDRQAFQTASLMMIKAAVHQITERSGSAIASMWSNAALTALRTRVPAIDQLAQLHSAMPRGPVH